MKFAVSQFNSCIYQCNDLVNRFFIWIDRFVVVAGDDDDGNGGGGVISLLVFVHVSMLRMLFFLFGSFSSLLYFV